LRESHEALVAERAGDRQRGVTAPVGAIPVEDIGLDERA
jgi:hypothetical protein